MLLAIDAATILFPTGNTRLSTIVAFAAFVALALMRRSWLPLAGCVAWLFGFEAAFNATVLALGRPAALDALHFVPYLALGAGLPFLLARRAARPNWYVLAAAGGLWAIWVASGFHVNEHQMVGFDPLAEALNEGAKTLWAAAYFLPIWMATGAPTRVDAEPPIR
ncbi:MAG: hypothetical protein QOG85_532 [Gaiellaceae bacterium]|jgi:hypothetical protein|nr:hypothetical protein [Gaiellaceae bacterium]